MNFRFYLTVAAADDRAAVIAQVDELLAAHRATPPAPLLLVDPDDAPLTAVRPDRRALGAAAVAAVVFVTLGPGALGPGAWGPRGPVPSAEIVALDLPSAGVAIVPTGPVGPVAPRSRVGSADSAVWSPPNVPAARPSAVPTVAETAVVVALPPAVAPTPSASSVPTPGPVPTMDPPASALPTPPVASASPTATPTPAVTATPSPDPGLLAICLDPLQLPLLDPLLCPSPAP
ncbi:hypothetical protein [Micromonospora sp. NPDC048843]|uniref:hypothetical protein n=1 Tax=Micromonospora sp. NPDC048843 TaxID=3155389 RepID=UPI0033DF2CBB